MKSSEGNLGNVMKGNGKIDEDESLLIFERMKRKEKKRMGKEEIKLIGRNLEDKGMGILKEIEDGMDEVNRKKGIMIKEIIKEIGRKWKKDNINKRCWGEGIIVELKREGKKEKIERMKNKKDDMMEIGSKIIEIKK